MDPIPYKIKRFRRLQSGEVQELEPIRKEVCFDPIGNHIILLRRYIRQVNELLDTVDTEKELPDMPLPDYPEDFPCTETLLSKKDFPVLRMRFLSPVSKAFVEQQQIVSILKILAQTGYYVKDSKVIMKKKPDSKAKDLEAEKVSSKDSVSGKMEKDNSTHKKNSDSKNKECEPTQEGDSTQKKNSDSENKECEPTQEGDSTQKNSDSENKECKQIQKGDSTNKNSDSENKECEKLKNARPNNKESVTKEQKNKTRESSTDKITENMKNKDKRNITSLKGITENESMECEEELKKSQEADKDKGNENKEKSNTDTGNESTESENSEKDDTENEETEEDTETEDSEIEDPVSEEKEVFPVKVLSYYLTEFLKNFVALMQSIKLNEPYPEDNKLWNALETALQRIGFDGIEGLYQFYYEKVYQRHEMLLKHCEDLQKKYNEYREKLKK